jgi:hypothetical protein
MPVSCRGRWAGLIRRIHPGQPGMHANLRIFEPVSAEFQPVSARSLTKNLDIENSTSRDLPPDLRPLVRAARIFSRETGLLAPNLRKCRHFVECGSSPAGD